MTQTMTFIDYAKFVATLAKPGADIIASLTPEKAHLLHMVVGISGEAGELLDAIKKHVIYSKPLDTENVLEELGDLMFYMQGIMNTLGLSFSDLKTHNMQKLYKRYEGAIYSDERAQQRADKAIDPIISVQKMADAAQLIERDRATGGDK
jgi:NTP pyrophosphatase (non-canonical NTP hydrolase)